MTMSQLLLRNKGRLKPRRWFCSDSHSSTSEKPSEVRAAAKDKGTEPNSPFIERYVLKNSRAFPKVELSEKLSGSWHVLKDVLGEMKSKMLTDPQNDKQIIAESDKSIGFKENMDKGKLDGPEKRSLLLTAILKLQNPDTPKIKDSEDLALVKSSESTQVCGLKQVDQSVEMSDVDQLPTEEIKDLAMSSNSNNINLSEVKEEQSRECLIEMLDVEKSHIAVLSSKIVSSVEIAGSAELSIPRQTEVSTEYLASTVTASDQTNSTSGHFSSHILEEEDIIRTSISDIQSSDMKLSEKVASENEDIYSPSANQNSQETEAAAYINISDVFNMKAEIHDLYKTKTDCSKQDSSNLESRRPIMNLVDIFKKSQKDSENDKLTYADKLERDETLDTKQLCQEDSVKPDVRDLIDKILQLSSNTPKVGSGTDLPSDSPSKSVGELGNWADESMKFPYFFEEHADYHNKKVKVRKIEIPTENEKLHKTNSSNFVVKNDIGETKQRSSTEFGKRDSRSNIPEKEININEESNSNSDIAAFNYPMPKPSGAMPLPFQMPHLDAGSCQQLGSCKNLLLVKFLVKAATVNDLSFALSDCGPISEIRIVDSTNGNMFNYAYICFKTADGLERALSKDDITVCGTDVAMEAVFPKASKRRFDAESVTDLNFPVAFLKNPSRTILVKDLSKHISFHDLVFALSNWECVSGIAMGSSPSRAYVEFKSEEAKERVLAEAKVSVSGKKLSILRVDSPKTTVVRISNINPLSQLATLESSCNLHGRVRRLVNRDASVFDVYYASSEWPNMLNILNRLNGLVVDQHQWIAQPATVIPPELLQYMWDTPERRKHVYEMVESICRKIDANSVDSTSLFGLAQQFYR